MHGDTGSRGKGERRCDAESKGAGERRRRREPGRRWAKKKKKTLGEEKEEDDAGRRRRREMVGEGDTGRRWEKKTPGDGGRRRRWEGEEDARGCPRSRMKKRGKMRSALLQCTAADTYTVGDTDGWFISPQGAQFYTNWVSGKTFEVDDVLTFNFNAGDHDVVEVSKAEFDACTASNPIGDVIRSSPASITLDRPGSHYFICTFPQHCAAGQKLAVDVVAATDNNTPTPTTATPAVACGPELAPTSGRDSPVPPNASPSLTTGLVGVTGVVAAVFSAFVL
ncbi:hypothetical protein ACLOJK_040314 [Asimina triloba]